MIFTITRSKDPDDAHAPFMVLQHGQPFVDGLEYESEAQSIADLLNTPLKIIPMKPQSRFIPRLISRAKLQATRRLLRDEKGH